MNPDYKERGVILHVNSCMISEPPDQQDRMSYFCWDPWVAKWQSDLQPL